MSGCVYACVYVCMCLKKIMCVCVSADICTYIIKKASNIQAATKQPLPEAGEPWAQDLELVEERALVAAGVLHAQPWGVFDFFAGGEWV